jgi:UDP-2,3-diacylglucosamine pyrophosphatase LpxH
MTAWVTSDLHVGSRFFRCERFEAFVRGLPEGATLVLNGDTVDYRRGKLPASHLAILELLRQQSRIRPVVWVTGNHDDGYALENPGEIRFVRGFDFGKRLYVAHGHDFDNVMPYHRTFIRLFRTLHLLRMTLGCEAVHVAQYAKKWGLLYGVLRRNVLMNAVEFARENGYAAVTCGHTHYPEERAVNGIRYFNTGSWTEQPSYCVRVTDEEIVFEEALPSVRRGRAAEGECPSREGRADE